MKQLSLNGKEVLMCEVKCKPIDIKIVNGKLRYETKENYFLRYIPLPPGSWHLLGLASEISSTTWASIVEQDYYEGIGYQYANYELERKWTFGKRFNSPTASGLSLLKAHGYKAETTLILVKQ